MEAACDHSLHFDSVGEPHSTGNPQYRKKPCFCGTCVENETVVNDVFRKQKLLCLSKIDLSKKGSIDEAVVDIVAFINNCDQYFTTSSCSGRIYIYEEVATSGNNIRL